MEPRLWFWVRPQADARPRPDGRWTTTMTERTESAPTRSQSPITWSCGIYRDESWPRDAGASAVPTMAIRTLGGSPAWAKSCTHFGRPDFEIILARIENLDHGTEVLWEPAAYQA